MPEEVIETPVTPPKQKRKYVRKPKEAPASPPEAPTPIPTPAVAPRARYGSPRALAEVDAQLEAAIAQRPEIHERLSQLAGQTALENDRLNRLNQQIGELVQLQRQLDGEPVTEAPRRGPVPAPLMPAAPTSFPTGEIPPHVGSIPAKAGSNVADRIPGGDDWK